MVGACRRGDARGWGGFCKGIGGIGRIGGMLRMGVAPCKLTEPAADWGRRRDGALQPPVTRPNQRWSACLHARASTQQSRREGSDVCGVGGLLRRARARQRERVVHPYQLALV